MNKLNELIIDIQALLPDEQKKYVVQVPRKRIREVAKLSAKDLQEGFFLNKDKATELCRNYISQGETAFTGLCVDNARLYVAQKRVEKCLITEKKVIIDCDDLILYENNGILPEVIGNALKNSRVRKG